MRVTTRIHEWFAERVPWVQYPDARFPQERKLLFRLRNLTGKQRWWVVFAIFWISVIALSIYGNSL
jgi:hypothetical protein